MADLPLQSQPEITVTDDTPIPALNSSGIWGKITGLGIKNLLSGFFVRSSGTITENITGPKTFTGLTSFLGGLISLNSTLPDMTAGGFNYIMTYNSGTGEIGKSTALTSAWTTYTPVVSGSGGGSGTISISACKFYRIGKTCIYEGQIGITNKNTLTGDVLISLPVACLNQAREFIKAETSFIGAVGQAYGTQNRVVGIQGNSSTTNMLIATTFAQPFTTWASMTNGEFILWRVIYETV